MWSASPLPVLLLGVLGAVLFACAVFPSAVHVKGKHDRGKHTVCD